MNPVTHPFFSSFDIEDKTFVMMGVIILVGFICSIPLAIFGDRINDYLERHAEKKRKTKL